MGDGHHRHNRRSRNLMATLKKAKNNDVRKAILEALQREFDRMSQSKLGKRVKPGLEKLRAGARRGAMGTSSWGKRMVQRGENYAKRPARHNHTRSSMGAYARKQAAEREKNRPAREASKQARQQQRQTRHNQRAARPATGMRARVQAMRAARASRQGQTPKQAPARTGPQRAKRADPPKRAIPARPAADARKARAAKPAARTPALPSETIRPTRAPRASRAPRSAGGSTSKTG